MRAASLSTLGRQPRCIAPTRSTMAHRMGSSLPISCAKASWQPAAGPMRVAGRTSLPAPVQAAAALSHRRSGLLGSCPRLQPARQQPSIAVHSAAAAALSPLSLTEGSTGAEKEESIFSTKYDAEIWSIAFPALCGMMLEPILSAINASLVGHLGTQQLSAVSLGGLAVSFCTFLFSFLLFLTTPMIAEAVVKKDFEKGSRVAAKSFWLALIFGLSTSVLMLLAAPSVVQALRPPEPAVALYATQYIRVRSLGILASLTQFVAIGAYRGYRDTRTPLYAAVGSGATSLAFNLFFIYGLNLGVWGSGLATTLAQYVSCACLLTLMVRQGKLRLADLARPPSPASMMPLLRAGGVLALRNMIAFGMVVYGSTLCVRSGATTQASFEVIRQVWVLAIQCFECLNVATQTLCAAYLGARDVVSARAVFRRLLLLGALTGTVCGAAVFAAQLPLISFFTRDPAVVQQVLRTMPIICLLFPADALASILDGSLLAARDTDYMSYVQIGGSLVQYGGLVYLAQEHLVSTMSIWACLKLMTFVRIFGGGWRHIFSAKSAYRVALPAAAAAVADGRAASAADAADAAAPAVGRVGSAAAGEASFSGQRAHERVHAGARAPPAAASEASPDAGRGGSAAAGAVSSSGQLSHAPAVAGQLSTGAGRVGSAAAGVAAFPQQSPASPHSSSSEASLGRAAEQRQGAGTSSVSVPVAASAASPSAAHSQSHGYDDLPELGGTSCCQGGGLSSNGGQHISGDPLQQRHGELPEEEGHALVVVEVVHEEVAAAWVAGAAEEDVTGQGGVALPSLGGHGLSSSEEERPGGLRPRTEALV